MWALTLFEILLEVCETFRCRTKGISVFAECESAVRLSNICMFFAIKLREMPSKLLIRHRGKLEKYLADGDRRNTNFVCNEPTSSVG